MEIKYGITTYELHDRIIKAMLQHSRHFDMDLEDILEDHDKRPLEQTINMCLTRLYLGNE